MKVSLLTLAIKKDAIAGMPTVAYDGAITLVDDMATAKIALRDIRRARCVGFDTETKPSFRKGRTHNVALMQISTETRCYLFRLNILGIFDDLKAFLEDENIIKIGLSVHDDFNVMRRTCEIEPKGFIDLQTYVKQFHISDISLQKIYAILFGERISKNQRLTNWEAEALTEGQQQYAAIDAWACLKIYNYLRSGAFKPAESPYVVEPEDNNEETENTAKN
jgi:ribonuclease D